MSTTNLAPFGSIRLDKNSPTPIYVQIAEITGELLRDGVLPAEYVLPPNSVTTSFTLTSPSVTDWFGSFHPSDPPSPSINWEYTSSCSQTAGATAKSSGSSSFTMPTTSGTYELRLNANNGYTRLATSGTVTVNSSTSTLLPGRRVQY